MLSNWQRPESVTAALVRAWGNRPVYIYVADFKNICMLLILFLWRPLTPELNENKVYHAQLRRWHKEDDVILPPLHILAIMT